MPSAANPDTLFPKDIAQTWQLPAPLGTSIPVVDARVPLNEVIIKNRLMLRMHNYDANFLKRDLNQQRRKIKMLQFHECFLHNYFESSGR